jgi:asparagine synthase (glutamine-hydrolysing)
MLQALARPLERRYGTIPGIFHQAVRRHMLTPALRAAAHEEIADYAERFYCDCNAADYIERLLDIDLRLWLPDDLLVKVDRATMAHSLEARVPYLDQRFVGFVASLPAHLKQRGDTRKYVLRRLAERYLPAAIVHRPKQGFVMPVKEWLRGPLREHTARYLSGRLARRGIIRSEALARLLDEHESGRRNHSFRIWALLVLELWLQRNAADFRL